MRQGHEDGVSFAFFYTGMNTFLCWAVVFCSSFQDGIGSVWVLVEAYGMGCMKRYQTRQAQQSPFASVGGRTSDIL